MLLFFWHSTKILIRLPKKGDTANAYRGSTDSSLQSVSTMARTATSIAVLVALLAFIFLEGDEKVADTALMHAIMEGDLNGVKQAINNKE